MESVADNPAASRYELHVDGKLAGFITYHIRGQAISLNHTEVDPGFQGGGIAGHLARYALDDARKRQFMERLEAAFRDVSNAVNLLWNSASVQARFEGTGAVEREDCVSLGMVGPAARACGIECDVRYDFPSGIHRFSQVPVSTWPTGDVLAAS